MFRNRSTITHSRHRAHKRWPLLASLVGALAVGVPVSVAAATHVSRVVDKFTVSADSLCGFTGTSYWVLDVTSGPTAGGSSFTAGPAIRTFIADNGRGVKIAYEQGVTKAGPVTYYPDGSSSVTLVEDGLLFQVYAVRGGLLEQSTGRLTFTVDFDANGNIVSQTIDSTTGPLNVSSGPDCSVIGPYLAG